MEQTNNSFKQQLVEGLEKHYPRLEFGFENFQKNNQVSYEGLYARSLIGNECYPVIPLSMLEYEYQLDKDMTRLIEKICGVYRSHLVVDLKSLLSPDGMNVKLSLKIVNFERNKQRLKTIPHKKYLDLAVVCCIKLETKEKEGIVLVSDVILQKIGYDREELFRLAEEQYFKSNPIRITPIEEVVRAGMEEKGLCYRDFEVEAGADNFPTRMYVMTNEKHKDGAVSIIYTDEIQKFSHSVHNNLYLIPSSTHEIVIVEEGACTAEGLKCMLGSINRSCVPPEEWLSDNVYYYSSETNRIEEVL